MIPIIDTHLHLIYPDRFAYPWITPAHPLSGHWSIEAYLKEARPLGIEASVHMEVDVAEADIEAETRYVLHLDGVVGAIAACRPEHPDFPAQLERLAAMPGVRGLRRILHEAPDELSQTAQFAEHLRRLPHYGLTFDLCVRHDQLPIGEALVRRCPDVAFVLDHCGAQDIDLTQPGPWRENIRSIARLPNLNAKVSGIMAYAGRGWTVDGLRPYVEHIIDCFGWDRVVWGSDHPVVTLGGTLTDWVNATREIIAKASTSEQQRLLNGNARRIYRL
ncbi:Predicted metal-dependent hydrolase, TIM-barrel fold [Devosia lucknowensis]|uniref:Predicted metal-dependent hydrolase, TIM-barrel fold n=1 Tax=Devosia lucknowensis TaxID=1096929 RepID=A0A1Y6FE37_9HYPH|nr:amidohydrolase [Devosia lucknowensis]SMQ72899.1 Predicted metal-dependent hydrolase, TIM-barrel fold [Devosia lucknowensis]